MHVHVCGARFRSLLILYAGSLYVDLSRVRDLCTVSGGTCGRGSSSSAPEPRRTTRVSERAARVKTEEPMKYPTDKSRAFGLRLRCQYTVPSCIGVLRKGLTADSSQNRS